MNTFGTFLLAIAAFIGTVMAITNPVQKLIKWARGKKKSEIEAETQAWYEEHGASDVIGKGCSFIFFVILSLIYTFIVEPLAVISALVNKIGYQPLAYAMLAIVALAWLHFARSFTKKKPSKKTQGAVVTDNGQHIEGTVVETDEEIKLPNPVWTLVNRIFFSLPTFYLWYLVAVSLMSPNG